MPLAWTVLTADDYARNVVNSQLLASRLFLPLRPKLMIRELLVGMGDPWTVKTDRQTFSRDGLLAKSGQQRQPGVDPAAQNLTVEQWDAYLASFNDSLDIAMGNTPIEVFDEFEKKGDALMGQAGLTTDARVRNLAWAAGLAGNTYATDTSAGSTSLPVACCFGFHVAKSGSGTLDPVAIGNPRANTIGASTAASVIGCTPTSSAPQGIYGPGVLTLAVAKAYNVTDRVIAATRTRPVRSGGGLSMHSLAVTDELTPAMIQTAAARLAQMNVPTFPNGHYRGVFSPKSIVSLTNSSNWRQQNQGQGTKGMVYEENYVGTVGRVDIYETSTAPSVDSVDGALGAGTTGFSLGDAFPGGNTIMRNATDVRIERPLVFGAELVTEHPMPGTPISDAGLNGVLRATSYMDSEGIRIDVNGVQVYYRAPIDKLGETVAATWKTKAGYGLPTDRLSGDSANYKRAVCLEHGAPDDG